MERAPAPDLGLTDTEPPWALLSALTNNRSGMTVSVTLANIMLRWNEPDNAFYSEVLS